MRVALIGILLSGCILPEISLDGKACPCVSGYVCDESVNVCVRMLDVRDAAEDAGTDTGSDAGDDAGEAGVVGPIPECARDTECEAGSICVAGACEPGCATTGCAGDQTCDPSGRCFANDVACNGPTDCNPPHHVCIDGMCEPGCAVGEGTCTENRICDTASGFCEAAPRCSLISPCPDRAFVCAGEVCLRRCDAPGAAPCLGGTECNQIGRCAGVQLGDFCSGDDDCTTGLCYSTVDPPARFCTTPCGRTADCPLGFSCLPTGNGYRVCVPEDIFNQVTFDTASGESCTNPNNVCQSNICEASTMTCTERCARDEHCAAYGTDCVVRQQMIQGQPVFTQECRPGPGTAATGETCSVNSDCASGICNKYENVCADACCSDRDCGPNENCLVYDLDNRTVITVCQPSGPGTTPLGMPCTAGTDCESGTCTPASPFNLTGPKICSVRCCTHDDCNAFPGGYCHPIPGVLPGTQAATCFPGN